MRPVVWIAALLLGLVMLAAAPRPPAIASRARSLPPPTAVGAVPPAAPTAVPTPAGDVALASFVQEAEAFVSEHRGLAYKRPVDVQLLPADAFEARVRQNVESSRRGLLVEGKLLRALGMVDPGLDVVGAEAGIEAAGVVGFYDPQHKQLVVRGGTLDAEVKQVLVHELTHALQDQNFDLAGRDYGGDDERGTTFTAVLEGDAVRIERQYIATLSASERRSLAAGGGGSFGALPPVMLQLDAFPYVAGPAFLEVVAGARGRDGIDALFRDPPASTAQLLHPELYLEGTQPVAVNPPPADGDVFDHGALGEMGLLLLFMNRPGLTSANAREVAAEWAGDRYVAWDGPGGTECVRDQLAARSPAALGRLSSALGTALPQAQLTLAGDRLTVTSCA